MISLLCWKVIWKTWNDFDDMMCDDDEGTSTIFVFFYLSRMWSRGLQVEDETMENEQSTCMSKMW